MPNGWAKHGGKKGAPKRVAHGASGRKGTRKASRKPSAAFMKPMVPSPALAKIVGDKPIPRTEVVRRLWAYVKKHELQDRNEKRNINADEALRDVFKGRKQVSMFEMTKLVNENLKNR
jgi:upstream activation factor subunit UAF30